MMDSSAKQQPLPTEDEADNTEEVEVAAVEKAYLYLMEKRYPAEFTYIEYHDLFLMPSNIQIATVRYYNYLYHITSL